MTAHLDEVFERAISERRLVGAVASVLCNGEVVYQRAHGLADRQARAPMTLDTRFRLASVTKPVTTLCALNRLCCKIWGSGIHGVNLVW